MKGRFSHPPDPEHGNPLKPVQTRDDVGKTLANAIVARFRRIFSTLRARFPFIPSFFGESEEWVSRQETTRTKLYVTCSIELLPT